MRMEPPAYNAPEDNPSHPRSIQDLRAQILANGSILRPKIAHNRNALDHIEIIVAKAPAATPQSQVRRRTHWTEEQASAIVRGLSGANLPVHLIPPAESMASTAGGKHYALLIKRSATGTPKIFLKGEPRDSVEDALEWILDLTEKLVNDLCVRHARPADDGCCIM